MLQAAYLLGWEKNYTTLQNVTTRSFLVRNWQNFLRAKMPPILFKNFRIYPRGWTDEETIALGHDIHRLSRGARTGR
jgi:hypothetical protein